MKIGILTFINAPNFGAQLQAYASQSYINSLGHNAQLINYTPVLKKPVSTAKSNRITNKLSMLMHPIKTITARKKVKKIYDFKNKYIHLSDNSYKGEISHIKEDYDLIFAGSDQIWNTDLNCGCKSFYLDFETSAKKAGYAVSVGRQKLTESDKKMIHNYFSNFYELSVREVNLKNYIEENEATSCEVVCDPVFLLNKEEWDNVAAFPSKQNYIFVYAMEYNESLVNTIKYLKRKYGKKVYYVAGGSNTSEYKISGKELKGIGPDEFIGLINNADMVVTNSFHGAAFAIIFNKNLYILEHSKRNDRLKQLTSICNFDNKIIRLSETTVDYDHYLIDGKSAYLNMSGFIDNSKKFILKTIEGK